MTLQSQHLALDAVLAVLENDSDTLELLFENGMLRRDVAEYDLPEVETARVAHTLLHDLDVNWEGTEIILRLRDELLATRRQFADLLELMRRQGV